MTRQLHVVKLFDQIFYVVVETGIGAPQFVHTPIMMEGQIAAVRAKIGILAQEVAEIKLKEWRENDDADEQDLVREVAEAIIEAVAHYREIIGDL